MNNELTKITEPIHHSIADSRHLSRRQVFQMAVGSLPLAFLPSCASTSSKTNAQGLYLDDLDFVMSVGTKGSPARSPIAENVLSHLEKHGSSRMTVRYTGTVMLAKSTDNPDGWSTSIYLNNRRSAPFTVAVTFRKVISAEHELIDTTMASSINGAAVNFDTIPFLFHTVGLNHSKVDHQLKAYVYDSGIGVPFNIFSWRSHGKVRSMKSSGSATVPGVGTVDTWRWSSKDKSTNFKAEPITTEYVTIMNPETPGLVVSLTYQKTLLGRVVDQIQLNYAGVSFS